MWNMNHWGQITSCWVGQDKQGGYKIGASWERAQSNPRTRPGWTYSRGAARNSHSSMYTNVYRDYVVLIRLKRRRKEMLYIIHMTDFLHRLKINHDSHEFILECGTIANIQSCTDLFLKIGRWQLAACWKIYCENQGNMLTNRKKVWKLKKHCAWWIQKHLVSSGKEMLNQNNLKRTV